jgi:hypothetical protein
MLIYFNFYNLIVEGVKTNFRLSRIHLRFLYKKCFLKSSVLNFSVENSLVISFNLSSLNLIASTFSKFGILISGDKVKPSSIFCSSIFSSSETIFSLYIFFLEKYLKTLFLCSSISFSIKELPALGA